MSNRLNPIQLSVILPCRNEEAALAGCLSAIRSVCADHNINAEIIVSDSSTDRSPQIARNFNVRTIKHNKKGYGVAYLEAFERARGEFIFMADCDGSYDFNQIPVFLSYLNSGYDFVIGNRFAGVIDDGAMPWHHRYVGNPLLSYLIRVLFSSTVQDVHCGMRAMKKNVLTDLNLKTSGMEFASEMVIKAVRRGIKTKQVPINYHTRLGRSKLRSFVDGLRHLHLMLTYTE